MGRRVLTTALAIGAALALVANCGLRADERPQPIPRERLDPRLFEEGSGPPAGGRPVSIYVLVTQGGTNRLFEVPVPVPNNLSPERAALDALLSWTPATTPVSGQRLVSRIPSGTALRDVRRNGNILNVDLSDFPIAGTGQALAAAQIVYTATAIDGIDAVLFTIDGKPVAVPLGESSSTPGVPLRPTDFAALDLEPVTTATSTPGAAPGPTTGATTTTGAPAPPPPGAPF